MPSQETTNAVTEQRVDELEKKVEALMQDRDRALRWGIITLGGAVLGLLSWLVHLLLPGPK